MEGFTGLLIACLCSLFHHPFLLSPSTPRFFFLPRCLSLLHCAIQPVSPCHHPSLRFSVMSGPTPCFSFQSIQRNTPRPPLPPLSHIFSAFFPLLSHVHQCHLPSFPPYICLHTHCRKMFKWMDRWMDVCGCWVGGREGGVTACVLL